MWYFAISMGDKALDGSNTFVRCTLHTVNRWTFMQIKSEDTLSYAGKFLCIGVSCNIWSQYQYMV